MAPRNLGIIYNMLALIRVTYIFRWSWIAIQLTSKCTFEKSRLPTYIEATMEFTINWEGYKPKVVAYIWICN